MRRGFCLDRVLSPFFDGEQTESLRRLMSETGTIINGSVALEFFDRTRLLGGRLDLCVALKHAAQVVQWLMRNGYHATGDFCLAKLASFAKYSHATGFRQRRPEPTLQEYSIGPHFHRWEIPFRRRDATSPDGSGKVIYLKLCDYTPMSFVFDAQSSESVPHPLGDGA